MVKLGPAAALLVLAAPVLAQPDEPSRSVPAQEISEAAESFGTCIAGGLEKVQPDVSPESGAAMVLAGCAAQRQQIERLVGATIDGSDMPDGRKAAAREQLRTQLDQVQAQVAQSIRAGRAAAAPSE